MRKKRVAVKKQHLKYAAGIAVLAVLTVILVFIIRGCSEHMENSRRVKEGVAYLETLESKTPEEIAVLRKEIDKKQNDAQKKELIKKLMEPDSDVWSMFKDYVILGDSRAVGFYYFDYLDENRVLAGGGETIRDVEKYMDDIVRINPSYIYLCYGLNDISIGYWDTSKEYVDEYIKVVKKLSKKLPDAKIIVSSTLPAQDPAFDLEPIWKDIPKWSAALGKRCESEGITYVDNTEICDEHFDLWQDDGIHVREEFYPYWGRNLLASALTDTETMGEKKDEG